MQSAVNLWPLLGVVVIVVGFVLRSPFFFGLDGTLGALVGDTPSKPYGGGEELAWSPDSRTVYFALREAGRIESTSTNLDIFSAPADGSAAPTNLTADDVHETPLFRVDAQTGKVQRLTGEGHVSAVAVVPKGAVVAMNSLVAPDDYYMISKPKQAQRLTSVNVDKLAGIDMQTVSRFSFTGANNDTVYGYAVKPAGATGKVPVAYMVHGGPQGSSNNSWSYRWNPAVFAGAGYGLVAVDFHGSTGYGQAFTDAIRDNWGGWPLEDLQKGLAAATAKFGWLDGDNACALGASYGGYMMNWIEGQWPDRFKCIVQHDGVFDARAMAYETEELWFDEWEHGGKTYYEDPAAFEKWNPVNHVAAWKTPQLVITSEKDFRIPYTQGLAAFTALQRRDIPSRLLVFPNENHWVLKPKNSRQWYREVLGWMGKWTGPK